MMMTKTLVMAVILVLCSCGSDSSDGAPGAGHNDPQQACLDFADAAGKVAARCGQTYQEGYDSSVQQTACGNCANVLVVRDESSLRENCFPFLIQVSCDIYENGTASDLPASCVGQFEQTTTCVMNK